jgi:galactitol-specific phosphotransferase system IIB component
MSKKIVTACGLACSMAPLIAEKIKERLKKEKVTGIDIVTAKVPELATVAQDALCVVTTVKIRQNLGVPIIDGSEFVLGLDGDDALDEVMRLVKGK